MLAKCGKRNFCAQLQQCNSVQSLWKTVWLPQKFKSRINILSSSAFGVIYPKKTNALIQYIYVSYFSCIRLFVTLWIAACQGPLWDSPDKYIGVSYCIFLLWILSTQSLDLHLLWILHCRQVLNHWGNTCIYSYIAFQEESLIYI